MINGAFFTMALEEGLSAAIMNPYSAEMMKAYFSYRTLAGLDPNCADYIAFSETVSEISVQKDAKTAENGEYGSTLQHAVIKGLREQAAQRTGELICGGTPPLQIVQEEIIPALDTVGRGFEQKTVYLPQLLMSAEAAKAAFEVVKENMKSDRAGDKCAFIIATVRGDIHDIGKNIVKLILENYGFAVTDLGRDVAPEAVVEAVVRQHAPMVGLSALMTTTVPAMEETIRHLRREAPWCKVLVGGAVLNKEYADAIGADRYARDAMEAVRCAEELYRELVR